MSHSDEDRIRSAVELLGRVISETRGRRGRDFIRRLPGGEVLDLLDGDREGDRMERVQSTIEALRRDQQPINSSHASVDSDGEITFHPDPKHRS